MIRTAFLVFLLLLVSGLQLLAQTDPALLYARGKQAYDATDCVPAYGWLYAFQQAAPPTMINPVAQDVAKAIQYCRNKIDGALQAVPQLQAEINRLRGVGSTTQGLEIKPSLPAAISQLGPTYPMRCRGGLPVSVSGNEAHIDFETVGTAADPGQLQPGHCGWLDRPMRQGEPHTICHAAPGRPSLAVRQGHITATGTWSYLSRLDDADAVFTFQVANDGHGCMVASGAPTVTPPLNILVRPDAVRRRIP